MRTGRKNAGKRRHGFHIGLIVLLTLLLMPVLPAAAGEEAVTEPEASEVMNLEAEGIWNDVLPEEMSAGDALTEEGIIWDDLPEDEIVWDDLPEDEAPGDALPEEETDGDVLPEDEAVWEDAPEALSEAEEADLEEWEEAPAAEQLPELAEDPADTLIVFTQENGYRFSETSPYETCPCYTDINRFSGRLNGSSSLGKIFEEIHWEKKIPSSGTNPWVEDTTGFFSEGEWRVRLTLHLNASQVSTMTYMDGPEQRGRIIFNGLPSTLVWTGNNYSSGRITFTSTSFSVEERIYDFEICLQGTMPKLEVGASATVPNLKAAPGEDLAEKGITIRDAYWFTDPGETENWENLPRMANNAAFGAGRYFFAVRVSCTNPKYRLDTIWTVVRVNGFSLTERSKILSDGSLLVAESYNLDMLGTKDGIIYKVLDSKAKTAVATGTDSTLPKNVVIPAQVTFYGTSYKVTELKRTFRYSQVETVQIPATVTRLNGDDETDPGVFRGCWHLRSVTFAEGCKIDELGEGCFDDSGLRQVKLPGSLKKISYNAFYMCKNLQSVTIPASVEEIDKSAFSYCNYMQEVIIPENSRLKKIGNRAFMNCSSLSGIVLPSSLEMIEELAFGSCTSLAKVTFSRGSAIKTIQAEAFGYNTGSQPIVLAYIEGDAAAKAIIDGYIAWAKGKGWSYVKTNALLDMSAGKVSAIASQVYTGKALTPKVSVTCKGKTLTEGTDYTLVRTNNINVGTSIIILTGKGAYGGTLKKTFDILPKKTSLSKLKAGKKKATVKWKKQAVQTDGYEIQYSLKKKFKKGVKTRTVKGAGKKSVTIKKLKAGRKYYVRIRTWKTVGGRKYYSAWSKAKTVKIR